MRKITEAEKLEIARRLRTFQTPNDALSYLTVLGNLLGLAVCLIGNYYLYQIGPLYTAILWLPTAAFLGRTFICLHDCGHNNLFSTPLPNLIFGRICGMVVGIPFKFWQHYHGVHHSIVNNLDKRHLDIESSIMTHDEYKNASFLKRKQYDFFRNPVARVVAVPIILYVLNKIPFWFYPKRIILESAISTTIYVFLLYLLGSLVTFQGLIFMFAIPMFITQLLAATVFALQHKFEHAYWVKEADWDHFEVSLYGTSYIKFGRVMDWYTGNVGYHHIHHLNPKIPFYNLRKSEKSIREVVEVDPIYLRSYFKQLKAKVWDDGAGKMVKPIR